MPELIKQPIQTIETDKGRQRTGIGITTLMVLGVVVSLISDILVATNTDDDNYSLYLFAFIAVLVSSILFSIGWLWYAVKARKWLASFGWCLFSIGASFEMYFISLLTRPLLFYILPAIAMLFGLMLVYIGKRKKNNQSSPQSDISPR